MSPQFEKGLEREKFNDKKNAIQVLRRGGVGVLLTDTIYGLVGRANSRHAVARIYKIKGRNPKKPPIILIASLRDLGKFQVKLNNNAEQFLKRAWPGKVSVILPLGGAGFEYLHRGTHTLAFRLPEKKSLRALLKATGPLIAPSANLERQPPAKDIWDAMAYFGRTVDFYLSGGKPARKPSRLVSLTGAKPQIVRK